MRWLEGESPGLTRDDDERWDALESGVNDSKENPAKSQVPEPRE